MARNGNMTEGGSQDNGGFFELDGTGIDRSLTDAPWHTFTNLSSNVAGTEITDDDTNGWITVGAAVTDNYIYIAATGGFTAGWYHITARVSDNSFTITPSAGSSKSGGEGNIGGALALPSSDNYNFLNANSNIYIKTGTYVLPDNLTMTADGSFTDGYIGIIGYTETHGDICIGANRPVIVQGTTYLYNLLAANYVRHKNIDRTSARTNAAMFTYGTGSININCKSTNTGSGGLYSGGLYGAHGDLRVMGCEFTAPNATSFTNGVIRVNGDSSIKGCYIHDAAGVCIKNPSGDGLEVLLTTLDTIGTGIEIGGRQVIIQNNTIYNASVVGVDINNGTCIVESNVIDSCLLGVSGSASYPSYLDYNNMTNNTDDVDANATLGYNTTTNAPGFPDAGAGELTGEDLSADDAAPVYVFGTAGTPLVQGAGQPATGGGGGETAYGFAG